jgi:hypothetical protein
LMKLGAVGFGAVIVWNVYFINRYRKGDVQISDLVTLVSVLGGGAILRIFPSGSELFGGYGVGLAFGFFAYFLVLVILVGRSKEFKWEWFLDGRRAKPGPNEEIQGGTAETAHPMARGPGEGAPT